MNADEIKQIVSRYWIKKRWAVHFEVGLCKGGRYRADVLAMSIRGQLVIIEVKTSVGDFKSDHKMLQYKNFCDNLYVAMTDVVYDKVKHLIAPGVGVFVIDINNGTRVRKRSTSNLLSDSIRFSVVTRMAYRSADKTLFQRKASTSGACLVATTAVEAIQKMQSRDRKGQKQKVIDTVTKAISKYV